MIIGKDETDDTYMGKKKSYVMYDVEHEGNKTIFKHTQYVAHIQDNCKELRKISDGYSQTKELRHVARIPELVFLKYGHIFCPQGFLDEKAFYKWLETDEGRPYKTVNKL